MAQTAEELAERYGVTREEADRVALNSQLRAKAAWDAGRFDAEVEPVTVKTRKGESRFAIDEHMRPGTTMEALGRLRPYFKRDGLVTAGNASGIGDGAASTVLAERSWADAAGGVARSVSPGVVGVRGRRSAHHGRSDRRRPPRAALATAGLGLEEMDLVEVNEAFAPQYKAVEKELGLDPRAHQRERRRDRDNAPAGRFGGPGSRCTFCTSCGAGAAATDWGRPVSGAGRAGRVRRRGVLRRRTVAPMSSRGTAGASRLRQGHAACGRVGRRGSGGCGGYVQRRRGGAYRTRGGAAGGACATGAGGA